MFLNVVWADWQKVLYFYLPGSVLVKIERQWYSAETHYDQGQGSISTDQIRPIYQSSMVFSLEIELWALWVREIWKYPIPHYF